MKLRFETEIGNGRVKGMGMSGQDAQRTRVLEQRKSRN